MQARYCFVGGVDRSGTTYLGAELSKIKNIICLPECQWYARLLKIYGEEKICSKKLINLLLKEISFQRYWRRAINFSQLKGKITINELHSYLTHNYFIYITKTKYDNLDEVLFIDQTPANIRNFEILKQHRPNSKFIHIIRDPRAVINSLLRVDWGPTDIFEATDFWLKGISYGLALSSAKRLDYFQIRYEDLLLDLEPQKNNLCKFLQINYELNKDWSPSLLPIVKYNKKQHIDVGKSPQLENIEKWKYQLSSRQINHIQKETNTLIVALNYCIEKNSSSAYTYSEYICIKVLSYIKKMIRKIK